MLQNKCAIRSAGKDSIMRKNIKKRITFILVLALALTACGQSDSQDEQNQSDTVGTAIPSGDTSGSEVQDEAETSVESSTGEQAATELIVQFGDDGASFTLHLYDNDTAVAIARHVGTADWRLPIYHYDDYENWEVMQYYDIPSRYEIPSNPESVTTEQAGTVYYSEPNRIILFYRDAEVSGEYTPVGYFDYTEEFATAVEENPVLEGWGNKIVRISDGE